MTTHYSNIFNQFRAQDFFQSEKWQKTYDDFQQDIIKTSLFFQTEYKQHLKVVVKNKDPYLYLVEVFALWTIQKIPILISPKATVHAEQSLLNQLALIPVEQEALILFTSGTTNLPKGIALTFSNLHFQVITFTNFFSSKPHEVYLLNLPLNHIGGLMLCLRSFLSGGKISTIESHVFSYISLVPHQLDSWMNNLLLLKNMAQAKAILIGGAAIHPLLKERADTMSLPIYETYGMTESTSFIAINGKIMPDRELVINKEGHICIKGPMLAAGTYCDQSFHAMPEWLETNDLGLLDSSNENALVLIGRKGTTLISGGENISSSEILNIVLSIPGIQDAHVCAISDEKWGDLIVLLYESMVERKQEIEQVFSEKLHPYHIPKFFFKTTLNNLNETKITYQQITEHAYKLFLKNIFSHTYNFISEDKPTLVILHGFMENKDDWSFFTTDAYNVLTIDLPGHGETNISHFSSLHEILTRLRDFILLYSDRPVLLGYSMGGRIALNLSINYLKPKKLILISASMGLNTEEEKYIRLTADLKLFDKISDTYSLKQFFIDWYSHPMFLPYFKSPNFVSDIEKKSSANFKQWASSLRFFSQGNFPLKAEELPLVPIFFIVGSEDEKYAKTSRPNQEIIIGAGHNPHKTHTQKLIFKINNVL
jgi:2-succinyl-6-hydroxy-2,4-cyclohexadiene-1-carboxylate synthase